MKNDSETTILKGVGEIWASTQWRVGLWPRCALMLKLGALELEMPKGLISLVPEDVEVIRSFRLPKPSVTIIFRRGIGGSEPGEVDQNAAKEEQYALLSFSTFRKSGTLETFLEGAGFLISERRTWRTGLEAGKDGKRFQLEGHR